MFCSDSTVLFDYQAASHLLAVTCPPAVSSGELRGAYRTVLHYLADNHVSRVLLDMPDPATVSNSDQTWVAAEFLPALLPYHRQGQPPRIAYVLDPEAYQQLLADSPNTRVPNFSELICLQYFPSRQPALAWLQQPAC